MKYEFNRRGRCLSAKTTKSGSFGGHTRGAREKSRKYIVRNGWSTLTVYNAINRMVQLRLLVSTPARSSLSISSSIRTGALHVIRFHASNLKNLWSYVGERSWTGKIDQRHQKRLRILRWSRWVVNFVSCIFNDWSLDSNLVVYYITYCLQNDIHTCIYALSKWYAAWRWM